MCNLLKLQSPSYSMHRRRNTGGSGGTCPHKLQVVGAMPPQPEPSSIYAVLGLAMIHHLKFVNKKLKKLQSTCMLYSLVSSSLELIKKALLISPILKLQLLDSANRCDLNEMWMWVKIFHVRMSYAPTTLNIFLRLCIDSIIGSQMC